MRPLCEICLKNEFTDICEFCGKKICEDCIVICDCEESFCCICDDCIIENDKYIKCRKQAYVEDKK